MSQASTTPNFPGGWMIAGDARNWLKVVPYFKRTKVMNHVQKQEKDFLKQEFYILMIPSLDHLLKESNIL